MTKPLSIQPIPYQGSKRTLAPRICRLFPQRIETLYEPFAGSAAVSLYAASKGLAERFVIADLYAPLAKLWEQIIGNPALVCGRYEQVWRQQFEVGADHFNTVRAEFNDTGDPVLLLYLIARCVKNAVRFNAAGRFTQSVDKRRTGMTPDRLARAVSGASRLLKGRTTITSGDFALVIADATPSDLVYMDPPYQGTTYGRDKRYAAGLPRERLIMALSDLDERNVPYIVSYDGQSGERQYGDALPDTLKAARCALPAGRSSQATLAGRTDLTIESLYISLQLDRANFQEHEIGCRQDNLFA